MIILKLCFYIFNMSEVNNSQRNNHFNLLKDLILADDQLILADSLSNFHGSDQTASTPSNIKKCVVIRYVRSESIHFINHFHNSMSFSNWETFLPLCVSVIFSST